MSLLVILLLLVLALSLLLVVPRRDGNTHQGGSNPDEDVDEEELRDAEEELDGLSSNVTPEDADDLLPDWGPGVPKHKRDSHS